MLQFLGWLVSVALFAMVGWNLVRRRKRGVSHAWLIVLLVAAAAGPPLIGPAAKFVDILGFQIRMDWSLVGLCLGAGAAIIAHNRALRRRAT